MAETHTQSKLGSGNSRLRQRMKEECNIFIRRKQVPQAMNRFVRLLNGPCSTTVSAQEEPDLTVCVRKAREIVLPMLWKQGQALTNQMKSIFCRARLPWELPSNNSPLFALLLSYVNDYMLNMCQIRASVRRANKSNSKKKKKSEREIYVRIESRVWMKHNFFDSHVTRSSLHITA